MRLAISGTYSSGKTTTSVSLSHLTGVPRTHARTMREILPEAVPGKRLEECTVPELFQLGMIRYAERAVHESALTDSFISDGSSLHEWVYGKVRVRAGLRPGSRDPRGGFVTDERREWFNEIIDSMGAVAQRHALRAYDAFAHLPNEFPLVADGHRPVSEEFRALSDELLLDTLRRLGIPMVIIGGTLADRLAKIVDTFGLPVVMPVPRAIACTYAELGVAETVPTVRVSPAAAPHCPRTVKEPA